MAIGCEVCFLCFELVVRTGMHGKHVKAQRYHCKACGKGFNDKTGTVFANSNLPLRMGFFAAFLLQFRVSVMEISRALGIGYKAAFFMVWKLRQSLYARQGREAKGGWRWTKLMSRAGLKGKRGLKRPPRRRGLKTRGKVRDSAPSQR